MSDPKLKVRVSLILSPSVSEGDALAPWTTPAELMRKRDMDVMVPEIAASFPVDLGMIIETFPDCVIPGNILVSYHYKEKKRKERRKSEENIKTYHVGWSM